MKKYISGKNYLLRPFLCFLLCTGYSLKSRSIHRPIDPLIPRITTRWVGNKEKFSFQDSHLEEYALFKLFDKRFLFFHQLPKTQILYRHHIDKCVTSDLLEKEIQQLIKEVHGGKREFTHFTVLQEKNFNRHLASGLLIVKFKKYPFVVKLFIETPSSFVKPFDKGWEPRFIFFMSGGVNRHLTGFTRIKNLELINKKIRSSKKWSKFVDTPRKWFWVPPKSKWIELAGYNIGGKEKQKIRFPGTYCIIADAIKPERIFSVFNPKERKIALELYNYLDILVDAHINNFMIEKGTKKLVIVDTEHFPTVVGFRKRPPKCKNYTSWYLQLSSKCGKETFFRTKKERRAAQTVPNEMQLL
ncbi:hypothetical protein KC460_00855 [Candidatus Dependentiae bacterium]|nr:hypothetical protein [Candidatus Dependentiae bacterium]